MEDEFADDRFLEEYRCDACVCVCVCQLVSVV